jgi:tetratricopeptide (TPR) repeat protein
MVVSIATMAGADPIAPPIFVPSDKELKLLCLDYLRQRFHRSGGPRGGYLHLAVWALTRSDAEEPANLAAWQEEIDSESEIKENEEDDHFRDDLRMYTVASDDEVPLQLSQIVTVGLHALQAQSRRYADTVMLHSTQSPQATAILATYLSAVQKKGFFDDCLEQSSVENGNSAANEEALYSVTDEGLYAEKFRKVLHKFRGKFSPPEVMHSSAETVYSRMAAQLLLMQNCDTSMEQKENVASSSPGTTHMQGLPIPSIYRSSQERLSLDLLTENDGDTPKLNMAPSRGGIEPSESMVSNFSSFHPQQISGDLLQHPSDVREAEKFKNLGNTYMQQKAYPKAMECYTSALQCSPTGPQAHVYYSNRAAAAISLKQYDVAIQDSERAVLLQPSYGKAHARLGLAHFLSGHYRAAVEAYTVALKYEPDIVSSRNYLEKSALRLAEMEAATTAESNSIHPSSSLSLPNSFSVISELERSSHTPPTKSSPATGHHRSGSSGSHNMELAAQEAERFKVQGNAAMSHKDYTAAVQAYSRAIALQPENSALSHVYYANRSAAYCYLEDYSAAEADAKQAVALCPSYGKAHARLGLARFLQRNFSGAVAAYEAALRYDPDNAASHSYLLKARQKAAAQHRHSVEGGEVAKLQLRPVTPLN